MTYMAQAQSAPMVALLDKNQCELNAEGYARQQLGDGLLKFGPALELWPEIHWLGKVDASGVVHPWQQLFMPMVIPPGHSFMATPLQDH